MPTPAANETTTAVSGWTTETLFAHLVSLIGGVDRRFEQRSEAQESSLQVAMDTMTEWLAERDRRYEERFVAQQHALNVALTGVRDETQKALLAAKEAVTKAENATEKRFEGVNEFRAQLADQAATFIPRKEAEQRIGTVAEKLEAAESRLVSSHAGLGSRLDLMTGQATGANVEARLEAIAKQIDTNSATIISEAGAKRGGQEQVVERRANNAAVYATIGIAITVLLFLMTFAGYLAGKP